MTTTRFLAVLTAVSLAGCNGNGPAALDPTPDRTDAALSIHAQQANGPNAGKAKNKVKGTAVVTLVGSPADRGAAGITTVRFEGMAVFRFSWGEPNYGSAFRGVGTVTSRRVDRRRDMVVLTIEFRGWLGTDAGARPVQGRGRALVDTNYADTDGADYVVWRDVVLSFDAEYSGDGNDL